MEDRWKVKMQRAGLWSIGTEEKKGISGMVVFHLVIKYQEKKFYL